MAATNRAAKITKLLTAIKKHFKPVAPAPKEWTLLEHLLFACLVENSPREEAEAAFASLKSDYFDWNEVRVSTKRELAVTLKGLVDPEDSAERLKGTLQSLFESVYEFDLELMKKQNLGQSVKQIEKYEGATPFVVSWAVQNSLGGHSIPVNQGLLIALQAFDVITPAEAKSGSVPGLERTVPKNKGIEVGSILHQLGVEIGRNPYGTKARKLLTDIDPSCKDNLPKRPAKPEPKKKPKKAPPIPVPQPPAAKSAAAKKASAKKAEVEKAVDRVANAKKAAPKPLTAEERAAAKKASAKKKPATKAEPTKKKAASKPTAKKGATKKAAGKKPVKKKLVKKKVAKKTTTKKAASKPVKKKKITTAKKKSGSLSKKKPR